MGQPDWMPALQLRSTTTGRCAEWTPAAAFSGCGTLLMASHRDGVQALAPPGVPLPSSVGEPPRDTSREWRWALWRQVDWYPIYVDMTEPDEQRPLSLGEAVKLVPPDSWAWVHERCRALLLSTVGFGAPTAGRGAPDDCARASSFRCRALLPELESVFPNCPWRRFVPSLADAEVPDTLPLALS